MAGKRRRFSSSFKAKVAIEAVQDLKTISELAQKHKLHPTQITLWKKQLLAGAESVFAEGGRQAKIDGNEPQVTKLYEQIGRLNVQLEWLKKKVATHGE